MIATLLLAAAFSSDIVIYGSSPAALSAAVQAKRMGNSAIIVSPETRIGGLTTGGLGQTDIGNKRAFGGIALEFYRDVAAWYADGRHWKWTKPADYFPDGQCAGSKDSGSMWTFEPSAALAILEGWERRDGLDIRRGERLDRTPVAGCRTARGVEVVGGRIVALRTESGNVYRGKVFVDATYEGDLLAAAGCSYHVGRESNATYGETINGNAPDARGARNHNFSPWVSAYVKPGDRSSGLLPGIEPYDPAVKAGDGDRRVQAYCFRMCLTDVPENRIPFKKPAKYDERDYELLFREYESVAAHPGYEAAPGGIDEWNPIPSIMSRMPNGKTDSNNRAALSTDFIGRNWDWPEADYATRDRIFAEHLAYQQGLMWTLANHPRVPQKIRDYFSGFGTCRDEFLDGPGDGWQSQLYVREGRRLVGEYVMTEHNCRGKRIAPRPVALGAYTMDSHHVRRVETKDGLVRNEGNVEDAHFPGPYPIDYGALVPKRTECGNLIVPVCLSASHIAFGSIRMEPVFFALGQVAGTAAAQSIMLGCDVQDVPYAPLAARLAADGQVLAVTDTVWLDEPGVWDRMSGGHGRSWPLTNATKMVNGMCSRGVGTCAPSALYLALDGNALSFSANVGQLYGPNASKLRVRVWRETELAFESEMLDRDSGPVRVLADLAGARWVKLELFGIEKPYSGTTVWGDAKFEMKPGTRPHDIGDLTRQLGILTPPVADAPRINAPLRYGVRPGNRLFFRVPVSGRRPMSINVDGLPDGLAFDPATQLITGTIPSPGEYAMNIRARNGFGDASREFTVVVGETIALTPPIGWNSWNAFGPTVTAELVRKTADLMESLRLLDHGWAYLTIDDGWQLSAKRFQQTERRDANGEVKSNELFGDMKALADYVHSKGLKIGLYSSPGPTTCANYEGSWMHEFQDAKTYAKWGFDYLKHDWCSYSSVQFGEGIDLEQFPYVIMSQALRASGRDIIHSICQYGKANVASWGAFVGGQCWRTTGDKFDFWEDVVTDMKTHEPLWMYPRPGAWNDADMMLVGKTYWSDHRGTRLTPNEQYTHVSMWAMLASVMMIGCDLDGIDAFTLSLLTNDEVIEINQDVLGKAAAMVDQDDDFRYWARPLRDGSIAVAMVNHSPFEHEGKFCFIRNGLEGMWRVRDVWRNADEGKFTRCFKAFVPGHATKLIRLFPSDGAGLKPGLGDVRENSYLRKIEKYRPVETVHVRDMDGGCLKCD